MHIGRLLVDQYSFNSVPILHFKKEGKKKGMYKHKSYHGKDTHTYIYDFGFTWNFNVLKARHPIITEKWLDLGS